MKDTVSIRVSKDVRDHLEKVQQDNGLPNIASSMCKFMMDYDRLHKLYLKELGKDGLRNYSLRQINERLEKENKNLNNEIEAQASAIQGLTERNKQLSESSDQLREKNKVLNEKIKELYRELNQRNIKQSVFDDRIDFLENENKKLEDRLRFLHKSIQHQLDFLEVF